ncbi:hypothetical protein HG531_001569 [Fusarium graminearum]|nr:hypothetical protein HG531_001569 [Fusarium graminearum]
MRVELEIVQLRINVTGLLSNPSYDDDMVFIARHDVQFYPKFSLLILTNLLELAHFALGPSLTNEPHSVKTYGLSIALTLLDVDDKTRCLLELDVSQAQVDCSVSVPVFGTDLDCLRGVGIVGFAKVEVVGAVDVQVNVARSHHIFVVLGREGVLGCSLAVTKTAWLGAFEKNPDTTGSLIGVENLEISELYLVGDVAVASGGFGTLPVDSIAAS